MDDLYRHHLHGATWNKPCGGNQDEEEMESCALVAEIPGHTGIYAVADSKNPQRDELRFTAEELRAFARHVTEAGI